MSDAERMRGALAEIEQDLRWFFSCAGCVSRDDLVMMIRDAQRRVDSVRDLIFPDTEEPELSEQPLDSNF